MYSTNFLKCKLEHMYTGLSLSKNYKRSKKQSKVNNYIQRIGEGGEIDM
jgi:hypothetical protein